MIILNTIGGSFVPLDEYSKLNARVAELETAYTLAKEYEASREEMFLARVAELEQTIATNYALVEVMTGAKEVLDERNAHIAELERRVKFLENILACPNCYAIMENRHSCIFCGWKEQR